VDGVTWMWVIALSLAVIYLRFWVYPKARDRHDDAVYRKKLREEYGDDPKNLPPWIIPPGLNDDEFKRAVIRKHSYQTQARQPMGQARQPMGPSAPTGLSAPVPPVPFGGRVGPEYLNGAMRQQSTDALALIRQHFPPEHRSIITDSLANPDWDLLYRMAADLLGAIRWWTKVVSPAFNDEAIAALLGHNPIDLISSCIDQYRKSVPSGPDLDQALKILGFYLRNIQMGSEYSALGEMAWTIAALSLDRKVVKDKQAREAK
jgi:hypothetical protein